jgi:hypothetical protein
MDIMACPLRHQWDLRTRSPHTLFDELKGAVEELGYRVDVSVPFQVEESSFSRTATVKAQFSAERQVVQRYNRTQGGLGALSLVVAFAFLALGFVGTVVTAHVILVVAGFVLIMAGLAAVATAFHVRKQYLVVAVEGRARRVGDRQVEGAGLEDIVADVRVMAGTSTALFAGGTEIRGGLAEPRADVLEKDFGAFKKSVESMLPAYVTK